MAQKDNILEELKELNASLPYQPVQVYQVPVGYFDGLASQVLAKIKALEAANSWEETNALSPFVNAISRKMPYHLPENYFEELDTEFVKVDSYKELETLSPLLGSIKKQMPYSVPAGYFDQVSLPVRKVENKPAKLVALKSRSWVRYAAAAIVTGLIVVVATFSLRNNKQDEGIRVMAKVTKDVKNMNEVQKDNLLDFIDAGMNTNETAQVAPADKSIIKSLIEGVSDQELKDFQEQTEDIQDVMMTN